MASTRAIGRRTDRYRPTSAPPYRAAFSRTAGWVEVSSAASTAGWSAGVSRSSRSSIGSQFHRYGPISTPYSCSLRSSQASPSAQPARTAATAASPGHGAGARAAASAAAARTVAGWPAASASASSGVAGSRVAAAMTSAPRAWSSVSTGQRSCSAARMSPARPGQLPSAKVAASRLPLSGPLHLEDRQGRDCR
ncbi:hypothetical protein [Plantactinospora mayteni]|uniref:hypothetical protein n=1 Tax=Plantactinospora mayteni TaxID=566021 RepID=UPI0019444061|nr:hypothetical protein [Plantactinospora mayteni]